MNRTVDFLFEMGMLKKTPRTGWQFLGSRGESVADHSFRTAIIAYVLASMSEGIDGNRAVRMALFHDLPEARTGDLNYVNRKYATVDEQAAASDMANGLPFGDELLELLAEFREQTTPEAILVRDADNLEMLLQLKEHHDVGNRNAEEWVPFTMARFKTDVASQLARQIMRQDSSAWWFDKESDWWTHGGKTS